MDSEDSGINQDAQTQTAELNNIVSNTAPDLVMPDSETTTELMGTEEEAIAGSESEIQSYITPEGIIATGAVLTQDGMLAMTGNPNNTPALIALNMVDGNPVLTTDLVASDGGSLLTSQEVVGLGDTVIPGVTHGMNLATATIDGQQVIIVTDNNGAGVDDIAQDGQDQEQLEEGEQQQEEVEEREEAATEAMTATVKEEKVDEIEESVVPAPKRMKLLETGTQEGPTYILTLSQPDGSVSESEAVITESCETANQTDVLQESPDILDDGTFDGMDDGTVISQAWFTTRDDKTQLQNKGHSWRMGQWAKEEVELLQQNILKYCQERNIHDATEVIFEMSKDERKDFYRTVARGLNRPLFSVYRRVIRMYDQRNYVGKYSPGELTKLKELRSKHGADWATIGAILGRSASSVKDRCRLMRGTCNSGKWQPDEEKKLTEAVYELSGAQPGESITNGLSWSAVAERVISRTEKQCRTKWLNYLNWKQKGGTEWTREDDMMLINKIASSGASDETQLDWNSLAQDWASARSPQWLRGKWWSLKRHVPHYSVLSFRDLVTNIQHMNLQSLHSSGRAQTVASVKMGQLNLERVNILAVPMAVNADGSVQATSAAAPQNLKVETSEGGEGVSYEVLQQNTVGNNGAQGAFLITQPQSNPAISFASSTLTGTDHIIVHTLPISQVSQGLKQAENLGAVHLDPSTVQQHAIISIPDQATVQTMDNGVHNIEGVTADEAATVASLPLENNIAAVEQDLQVLPQAGIVVANSHLGQVDLDNPESALGGEDSQSEAEASIIMASQGASVGECGDQGQALIAQISGSQMSVGVEEAELDAVGVTSSVPSSELTTLVTSSPQFVQPAGAEEDLIHMSSLTDPMLMSDSADLAGPYSDIETEKIQASGETDVHVDSPSS